MKKVLLLGLMVFMSVLGVRAQRSYTFNVAAYNVDGLPQSISGFTVNPGGGEAEGATAMGMSLLEEVWQIVGLSEDFNFHNELVAPLNGYYVSATHGGGVDASALLRASSDGLGLLLAKYGEYPKYSNETRVAWKGYNGWTDNGADGLVTKGFRYYLVTLELGVQVDVYVLHMDAGDSADDISMREQQLGELRDYIASHNNGRHIFIIGDTNCRYTRENLKSIFVDGLHNKDNTLTVRDAWVECKWAGRYPTYGAQPMMVYNPAYGNQRGEVVDKILYIENSRSPLKITLNTYERDMTFPITDHMPVVASFTLTDPDGTATNDWTVEGGDVLAAMGVQGEQPVEGTTYYLKNVSSGLYLKFGGAWGAQAIEGSAGHPISVAISDGKYKLVTKDGCSLGGDTPFMDNTENMMWTLQPVENSEYQYYLTSAKGTLTSPCAADNPVFYQSYTGNDTQKWVFLNESRMKSEMQKANSTGFDVTPLIQCANFDLGNPYGTQWAEYSKWNNFGNSDNSWQIWNNVDGEFANYKTVAYYQSKAAASKISQTLSNMPVGRYVLTLDGMYTYYMWKKASSKGDPLGQTISCPVVFGSQSVDLKSCTSLNIGDYAAAYNEFRNSNTYSYTLTENLSAEGDIALNLTKPATTQQEWSKTTWGMGGKDGYDSWVVVDNFKLMYYPTAVSEDDAREQVLNQVAAYINNAWEEVQEMGPEAVAAYDITVLKYRFENGLISDKGEVEKLIVDQAVEVARTAANIARAEEGADMTGVIVNPSFETGDLTGWEQTNPGYWQDTRFDVTTTGMHGSHLLNSWCYNPFEVQPVTQTITGLKNGLYKLTALVATADAYGKVYLIGNRFHAATATCTTDAEFVEESLEFVVEDGTARIGVIGSYNGYYFPRGGCYFRADNFRLQYVCDAAHGKVKIAIANAKAQVAAFDEYGKAAFDISQYETAFENRTITGDGVAEVNAIYDALATAARAQKTVNAPMSATIENNNFEIDGYSGWTSNTGSDTKTVLLDDTDLCAAGAVGCYLFNAWNAGKSTPITQTVTGLPNGQYKVSAMVASDANNQIMLTANGTSATVNSADDIKVDEVIRHPGKNVMVPVQVAEFEVTDGTAEISVSGVNDVWYKADDFRMTYLGNNVILNETDKEMKFIDGDWYTSVTLNRNIKANTWSTFVVPFNMEIPTGWKVKELTSANQKGNVVSATFSDAATIKAGTPYMVRTEEDWTGTTVENTTLTSALIDVDGSGIVTFKGNYISGKVPTDAFFISDNKFYQATDNTNTLKAFRGYFEATGGAGVNVLNFTFDGEETAINGVVTDSDATIVAIYSLDGRRIESMQRGVNIVKLSDGKTKKVIVK